MELPFTIDQLLNEFRDYNTAIFPAQAVAYALGLLAVGLAFRASRTSDRTIALVLAALWMWIGIAYHVMFFSRINQAAFVFGAAFLVQGILFSIVSRNRLEFRFKWDARGIAGGILMVYALAGYPALGATLGRVYPVAPMFGVAPCPTTIFTFGMLLWARGRVPGWLLVVPMLWSIIGMMAMVSLGMVEDAGLLVAFVSGAWIVLYHRREKKRPSNRDLSTAGDARRRLSGERRTPPGTHRRPVRGAA